MRAWIQDASPELRSHAIDLFLGDTQVKLLIANEKHMEEDLDDTGTCLGK